MEKDVLVEQSRAMQKETKKMLRRKSLVYLSTTLKPHTRKRNSSICCTNQKGKCMIKERIGEKNRSRNGWGLQLKLSILETSLFQPLLESLF